MNDKNTIIGSLMGALLADAAALGLHWIYDIERIAEVSANRSPAFIPIDRKNYRGVKAAFVHQQRNHGALSQYGASLRLAIENVVAHQGKFAPSNYQNAFLKFFGPGGDYKGYIDAPTKGALLNIANKTNPSGVEDDQHPAISRLPAIIPTLKNIKDSTTAIREAVEITNLGEPALGYAQVFSTLLFRVLNGVALKDAIELTIHELESSPMKELLVSATTTDQSDSILYGQTTGMSCHLPEGLPLSFHILKNATSFRHALELNILAGGDSCGRALMIGSIFGASVGGDSLPIALLLQLESGYSLWSSCEDLANAVQ